MQRERLINTRPKRDLCKQEQLEVGAAKWERGSFGAKFLSLPPCGIPGTLEIPAMNSSRSRSFNEDWNCRFPNGLPLIRGWPR